jgi:hypothetical protein
MNEQKRWSNKRTRKKQFPKTTTICEKEFRRINKRHSTKTVGPNESLSERQNGMYDTNNAIKRPNRRKETRRKIREKQKQQITINNNKNSNNISHRNGTDIQDQTEQRIFDICKEHFGIIADPRFSVTKNINQLIDTYHPTEIPRQPKNLKVHNLCTDPNSISKNLLDTLGLNLNFGVSIKPRKDDIPIDFERL